MLNNILTHPTSTLTGIDLFPGDLKERYLANLQLSGALPIEAVTITGRSQVELRNLKPDSYDIIYIDGGHTADMVLADAVLSLGSAQDRRFPHLRRLPLEDGRNTRRKSGRA